MHIRIGKQRAVRLVYSAGEKTREEHLRSLRSQGLMNYLSLALLAVFAGPGLLVPEYGAWGWAFTGVCVLGCVALLFHLAKVDADLHSLMSRRGLFH